MSDQYPPQYPGGNEPPYQPPMAPPPAYAPQGYAPAGVLPAAGNSGLATASMILGIVGLCTGIAGIAAVICGHMALNKIKQSNNMLQGRGMAIAGLVLGYLEIAAMVGWVILIIIGVAFSSTTTPH